jgi:hypothetical protein
VDHHVCEQLAVVDLTLKFIVFGDKLRLLFCPYYIGFQEIGHKVVLLIQERPDALLFILFLLNLDDVLYFIGLLN